MRFARGIVLSLLLLGAMSGVPSAGAEELIRVSKFTVGPWTGGAYPNPRTGVFSHCGAYTGTRSGKGVLLRLNRDFEISMAFSADEWEFEPDASYSVGLRADNRLLGKFEAKADAKGKILDVLIGQDNRVLEALRLADIVILEAAQQKFYFVLTKAERAFLMIRRCVEAQLGLVETHKRRQRNPFVPGGWGIPANVADELGDRNISWETALSLLRAAGIGRARRLTGDLTASRVYYWEDDRFFGLVAGTSLDADDGEKVLLSGGTETPNPYCQTGQGARVGQPYRVGKSTIRTGRGFCLREGDGGELRYYSVGLFDNDLGIVFFIYYRQDEAVAARKIAEAFDDMLVAMAR